MADQDNDYSEHVMVALRPPLTLRERFASMRVTTEDIDDLHLTLLYLGTTEEAGGQWGRERLYRACYGAAIEYTRKIQGKVNGYGWFLNEDSNVLVALWDMPYLSEFRETLVRHCLLHGVTLREDDHGFTPHMTLTYQDESTYTIPRIPTDGDEEIIFDSIFLVWGEEWYEIPLT